MGDNWEKACGEKTCFHLERDSLDWTLSVTRLLIILTQGGNGTITYFTLKTPHKQQLVEIISCDWVTPLQLSGQITCGVCSTLWKVWGGHSTSGTLIQPPTQLLSSTNLPLFVSWVCALLFSPPLFLHPDLLFGDRRCTVFRPSLSFLFPEWRGDDLWSTTQKEEGKKVFGDRRGNNLPA